MTALRTYLVSGLFVLAMIGIVLYSRLKYRQENVGELFIAGRALGPVITAFSVFATLQSGFFIFGMAGLFYLNGVGAAMAMFVVFAQSMILYIVLRRVWVAGKLYNLNSQADFFADRYESPKVLRLLVGILGLLAIVAAHFSVQLTAMGVIMQTISGGAISHIDGMLFMTIGMLIITLIGGMRGLSFTDFVLGLIMMFSLIFIVVSVFTGADISFAGIYRKLAEEFPAHLSTPGPINYFTPQMRISFFFTYTFGAMMLPHMFVKSYVSKSIRSYKTLPFLYMGMTFPMMIVIFMLLGPVGRALLNVQVPDSVVPTLINTYVGSPFFQGLLLVAVLAAIVSTASSALLALSQIITVDIYKVFVKDKSERHYYWIGQAGVVLMTLFGIWVSINSPAAIGYVVTSGLGISAMMFLPVFFGLYWRRMNKYGVIAGMLSGIAVYAYITFGLGMTQASWLGFNATFWGLLTELAVMTVVAYYTPAASPDVQHRYFNRINYALYGREDLAPKAPAAAANIPQTN